ILAAWLTREGRRVLHEYIGYGVLVLLAVRIVWGFVGTPHARFADFVRSPHETLRYARQLLRGSAPRYVGHNPLGGWMMLALLALTLAIGATGWLYTTDRYWGVEWVERLHATLTDILLACVLLHVLGALVMSYRHRENLIAAMFHGRKRPQ
ncbi:MAG: cytochrome b/b6 domain-containing protein, partial [Steroidobacteraceae bacterium]|nr:cytochrome b/b6 domain-containing protein [Steroidobacteraceae bacterium]